VNLLITVIAYNRPKSLQRILNSISNGVYNSDVVDLAISIDYSGSKDCEYIANSFTWDNGNKRVILHEKNLGLRNHVLSVGNLVKDYDAIIMLEDDIVVSPSFFKYTMCVINHFKNEDEISGFSLYKYRHNENADDYFSIIDEGFDNFFMQVPSSWGQMWTKRQWINFIDWYENNDLLDEESLLPINVRRWPETSWKKYFYKYLILKNKYIVYPSVSYSSNIGDIGTHYSNTVNFLNTELSYNYKSEYNFIELRDSINIYDAYFELSPFKEFNIYGISFSEIDFDIYNTKIEAKTNKKYTASLAEIEGYKYKVPITLYPILLNLFIDLSIQKSENNIYIYETQHLKNRYPNVATEIIGQRILNKYKNYYRKIGENNIINTYDYKIGRYLLRPLRFLKRLMLS
jgi:hypothetical protein